MGNGALCVFCMLAGRWRGANTFLSRLVTLFSRLPQLATPTTRDAYDIVAYPVSTHCVYVSGGKGGGRESVCVCYKAGSYMGE